MSNVDEKRNNVKRPAIGTNGRYVWDCADWITQQNGRAADRTEVVAMTTANGIVEGTASTAYAKWRTFHGLPRATKTPPRAIAGANVPVSPVSNPAAVESILKGTPFNAAETTPTPAQHVEQHMTPPAVAAPVSEPIPVQPTAAAYYAGNPGEGAQAVAAPVAAPVQNYEQAPVQVQQPAAQPVYAQPVAAAPAPVAQPAPMVVPAPIAAPTPIAAPVAQVMPQNPVPANPLAAHVGTYAAPAAPVVQPAAPAYPAPPAAPMAPAVAGHPEVLNQQPQ